MLTKFYQKLLYQTTKMALNKNINVLFCLDDHLYYLCEMKKTKWKLHKMSPFTHLVFIKFVCHLLCININNQKYHFVYMNSLLNMLFMRKINAFGRITNWVLILENSFFSLRPPCKLLVGATFYHMLSLVTSSQIGILSFSWHH